MKKIIVLGLLIVFLAGCTNKTNLSKEIISNVEDAYTKASVNGVPTLQKVKSNFYMENADWVADQIMSGDGIVCDIKTNNNLLVVKCPKVESTKEMKLSN